MRGQQPGARRRMSEGQGAGPHWGWVCGLVLVHLTGCPAPREIPEADPPAPDISRPVAEQPLRLLVVGDDALAEVAKREWQAQSDLPLEVSCWDEAQLVGWLARDTETAAGGLPLADVYIYPSGFLGALATREGLVKVPGARVDDPGAETSSRFSLLHTVEVSWGDEPLAISLGAAPLVVAYRRDGWDVSQQPVPPPTWAAFRPWLDELPVPTTLPTGSSRLVQPLGEAWAGTLLLARAAAYVRDTGQLSTLFDYRSMEPLIDRAPFVRALEEMIADSELGPEEQLEWSPADTLRCMLAGQATAAITWLVDTESAAAAPELQLGLFELPGSAESYSFGNHRWTPRRPGQSPQVPLLGVHGRVASVSRASRRQRWAWQLLRQLTSGEPGVRVSSASHATAPSETEQLVAVQRWTGAAIDPAAAREYAALLQLSYSRHLALTGPRIPGYADYMTALNTGVHQALRKKATPEAALNQVAEVWRRIRDQHGLENSRTAYQLSLGLVP